jgi:hypothetical protein
MRTFVLLLLLRSAAMLGQAIAVVPTESAPEEVSFNERFIARNGIRSIVGIRMLKRDNRPMHEERERELYRFDDQGRLVYKNMSYGQPGSGRDTTSTLYEYDAAGLVKRRVRNDLGGLFAYSTVRDADGRPVRETYERIENLSGNRYNPVPGQVTEVSDEQFRYATVNDTCWRKEHLNNLGLPYRTQTFTRNRKGYLLSIEDHYLISDRRSLLRFGYDENGRLAERIDQPDLGQGRTTRHAWRYDRAGNVIEGEWWSDGKQVWREEYLYDEATMLPKARLRKDLASGTIHVVKWIAQR